MCDATSDGGQGWHCDICSQLVPDIMLLPCSHKYCEHCLRVWSGVHSDTYAGIMQTSFPCRVCWHHINVPREGGMSSFRQNVDVANLGLTLQRLSVDTSDATLTPTPQQVHDTRTQQVHARTDDANTNNLLCRDDVNMNAVTPIGSDVAMGESGMATDDQQVRNTCDDARGTDALMTQVAPALNTPQVMPAPSMPHFTRQNYAFPTCRAYAYHYM